MDHQNNWKIRISSLVKREKEQHFIYEIQINHPQNDQLNILTLLVGNNSIRKSFTTKFIC